MNFLTLGPGPVGTISCIQEPAGWTKLSCNWAEPQDKNGVIKHYIVKMTDKTDRDKTIFEGTPKINSVVIDETLNFEHTYTLYISGFTIVEGKISSTTVQLKTASKCEEIAKNICSMYIHYF